MGWLQPCTAYSNIRIVAVVVAVAAAVKTLNKSFKDVKGNQPAEYSGHIGQKMSNSING